MSYTNGADVGGSGLLNTSSCPASMEACQDKMFLHSHTNLLVK